MGFFPVLDLLREASGLLFSNSLPLLLLITLILIFPASSISLSQVISNGNLADELSTLLSRHLTQAGLRLSAPTSLLYSQLSQTLVSQAMCFPVILTLFMLAKAATFYLLDCKERGQEASVMGFLEAGPRMWSRIAAPYVCGCILVVVVTAFAVLLEVMGARLLWLIARDLTTIADFASSVYGILEMSTMLAYAVVLAPTVIILNMGTVVAGLEERKCGPVAILRVLTLLKRRKLQPALLLFVITGVAISGVEATFQYRVLGRATLPAMAASPASLIEAPFLIFAHSFLLLFDTILSVCFYHACRTEADAATPHFDGHKLKQDSEDDDADEDHFSIAVQVVEQQCRKIMFSISDYAN